MDLAFGDVVASSSDPQLGAIRLAWWRERLEDLDRRISTPGEPRLRSVEENLLPLGVTGAELSTLEDAWMPLLSSFPWNADQVSGLKNRGRILFGIGSRLVGARSGDVETAGALWSLRDGAEHCSDAESRNLLLSEAAMTADRLRLKVPPALRPLTILAVLAAFDLSPGSRLARGFAALRHRFTGRFQS